MIDSGFERITTEQRRPWRWWVWIDVPGFKFARGGRANGEKACRSAIEQAGFEALAEQDEFRFRPTHYLGPRGELVPIPWEPVPERAETDLGRSTSAQEAIPVSAERGELPSTKPEGDAASSAPQAALLPGLGSGS